MLKKRKQHREQESDGESSEEEVESEDEMRETKAAKTGKSKEDKEMRENKDKQSIFKYANVGRQATEPNLRMNVHMSMYQVTSADDFQAWTAKHMKEQTARAVNYLKELAIGQNHDIKGAKKQSTIIKRIAASYEIEEA